MLAHQRKLREGMDQGKTYADYLAAYERKMAPLRRRRLKEAKERMHELKKKPGYTAPVKNQKNPWILIDIKGLSPRERKQPTKTDDTMTGHGPTKSKRIRRIPDTRSRL